MPEAGTEVLVVALRAARPYVVFEDDPMGARVTVSAGPLRGHGLLRRAGDRYEGALEVALGPVAVHAYGLAVPEPASLVLLFRMDFQPPVQLGFGLTLQGVGGLLAVDRGISTEAILAGLRDGRMGSLLFPADPRTAAPSILAALAAFFPARAGGLAIGPAVELGWGGVRPLVTAKALVMLAVPGPTIAVLGSLRVAIPAAAAPIIDLNADLFAEVSPERTLVLASLQRSHLAGIAVGGDFGLLIGYGSAPGFAASAGGFHPRFRPPPELAGMARLAIDLSPGSLLTLRAEAYVAITDSAAMFGCRIELRAVFLGIGAEGMFAFDALLMWDPLHFEVDVDARVALIVFGQTFVGVRLALHLEGPAPWRVHGRATLELPFFLPDIDFRIPEIEWGPRPPAVPPEVVSARELVVAALADRASWRATAPPHVEGIVALRAPDPGPAALMVHPHGGLEVRQKAVPLNTKIDRVGGARSAESMVELGTARISVGPVAATNVTDPFALGLFRDLTDEQKLSTPIVERHVSGLRLSPAGGVLVGPHVDVRRQWRTVHPGGGPAGGPEDAVPGSLNPVLVHQAAAGRSALRRPAAYLVPDAPISFGRAES